MMVGYYSHLVGYLPRGRVRLYATSSFALASASRGTVVGGMFPLDVSHLREASPSCETSQSGNFALSSRQHAFSYDVIVPLTAPSNSRDLKTKNARGRRVQLPLCIVWNLARTTGISIYIYDRDFTRLEQDQRNLGGTHKCSWTLSKSRPYCSSLLFG
jgi:hypothetical protein